MIKQFPLLLQQHVCFLPTPGQFVTLERRRTELVVWSTVDTPVNSHGRPCMYVLLQYSIVVMKYIVIYVACTYTLPAACKSILELTATAVSSNAKNEDCLSVSSITSCYKSIEVVIFFKWASKSIRSPSCVAWEGFDILLLSNCSSCGQVTYTVYIILLWTSNKRWLILDFS